MRIKSGKKVAYKRSRNVVPMSDISMPKRQVLTSFGVYQMNNNPAGIGNECTHWIYAALFEARALDSDADLHIHQTGVNYTWGRRVDAAAVQRGDIAQFHGFQNRFFIYLPDGGGGTRWLELTKIRGPLHTGMVFVPPRSGAYYQLESHLHEAGTVLMRVRGHTIYYESFAVSIPMADFNSVKGSEAWPADINPVDGEDLLERVDWVGMRSDRSIDLKVADVQILRIKQNKTPTIGGNDVAVLFRVHTTGDLRFFCPQESTARLAMTPDQLAAEKARLIQRMIRGGRKGHNPKEDEFGGDNKQQRVHDHLFDWTYDQP
jgi:hypothetical protein